MNEPWITEREMIKEIRDGVKCLDRKVVRAITRLDSHENSIKWLFRLVGGVVLLLVGSFLKGVV